MRIPVIAGNWKMHKTPGEARALARSIREGLGNVSHCQVVHRAAFYRFGLGF